LLQRLINLFYPDLCAGCGEPLSTGNSVICIACRMQLPYTKFDSTDNNPVTRAFWGRVPVQHATALLYYQKHTIVQKLLHALKYRNRIDVADVFGSEMAQLIKGNEVLQECDALIPVPMHPSKFRTRGYNQAELLAKEVSKIVQKPMNVSLLKKESITNSQTHKGRFDRWRNSEENFVAQRTNLRHVILVDDVITTGATLEACINALTKANPELKVTVLAMAYTYR
jgi:competence protein ComFC